MNQLNKNQISNIFRLSSVLFSEDNYTIRPRQLHQKVIENALFELKVPSYINIMDLSEFIERNYNFLFTEDEIWNIVATPKLQEKIFVSYELNNERFVNLAEVRKQTLNNRVSAPNVEKFIELYSEMNLLPLENTKNLIYKFLYSVFTSNAENFKRLINNSTIQLPQPDNIFSDKEREIINGFLNWENSAKDKAIFNVASFALEYCLLTNTNKTSITIESLRNKEFYLDTNIIFRALGINGELRKNRTLSILNKFKNVGETLHISNVTEKEFRNSIHYHCQLIDKYNNPSINTDLFEQIADTHKDFFTSFQNWRIGKVNSSVELYEAYLTVQYENLIKNFQIKPERFSPYDKTLDSTKILISNYKEGILNYKREKIESKAKHDAENILWIEKKRNNEPTSIFEAKCFLLSSDHRLQNWDYNRTNHVPVVFLPSQWLSITLRFISRTIDDFSSFVSFLNLPYNERILDNDQIMIVLSGISEYASQYATQKEVYFKFMENKISRALDVSKPEILYQEAREFAKSEVEKELEKTEKLRKSEKESYEKESNILKGIISIHEKKEQDLNSKIEDLKNESITQKNSNLLLKSENEKLNHKLLKYSHFTNLLKWGVIFMFVAFLTILAFYFQEWELNYIAKLLDYCENLGPIQSDIASWAFIAVFSWITIKFGKCIKKWYVNRSSIL